MAEIDLYQLKSIYSPSELGDASYGISYCTKLSKNKIKHQNAINIKRKEYQYPELPTLKSIGRLQCLQTPGNVNNLIQKMLSANLIDSVKN